MATLQARGVDLFYGREGTRERVVLTHGAWSDGRAWPGNVKEDAADLGAHIEGLGGDSVHAVGHWSGGSVVLNLVTMRPDLVKTAAVHEPPPMELAAESGNPHLIRVVAQDKRHTDEVMRLIVEGHGRRAAEHFVEDVALDRGAWQQLPDELKTIMEANALTVPDDIRDGRDADSVEIEALAISSVPLLISTGSESPELERGLAHELARRVLAARLETLPGAGHIPHRTHADDYAALLIRFIEGASIARGMSSNPES